ncbi:MAG: hypothetical protein PVF33_09140 [Candidatus Latescibacterota bacterium]|jgi:hypothetical protein
MHRYVQSCLALLFLATLVPSTVHAQGITARNLGESLTGLNGVHVIVEELSDSGTEAGLSSAAIKSSIEAKLRSRGVPVLSLGALAMDPRGPSLLVKVDLDFSDPVYFYHTQVQFFQNVNLMTGDDVLTSSASASTWQGSKFGRIGKFRIASLPTEINKIVDAFATDYLAHNQPAAPEPEPEMEDDEDGEPVSAADSLSVSG